MQTSHSPNDAPERAIRYAVINGVPMCPQAVATLEARGVNVGELEQRLRQSLEFVR